jgi:hypothetical protein
MNDDDIRSVVREVIARQISAGATVPPGAAVIGSGPAPALHGEPRHASHGLLTLERGGDIDGNCLIEPAVRCTHCGYCQSYGH